MSLLFDAPPIAGLDSREEMVSAAEKKALIEHLVPPPAPSLLIAKPSLARSGPRTRRRTPRASGQRLKR